MWPKESIYMSIPISSKVRSSLQRFYENKNINKIEKYFQCTLSIPNPKANFGMKSELEQLELHVTKYCQGLSPSFAFKIKH